MHALDALQFVLGDLADIRATSAVRRPAVTLADTQETITRRPGPSRHRRDAEERRSRLGLLSWRHVRGDNFRWKSTARRRSRADVTSAIFRCCARLEGGRGEDRTTAPLAVPARTIWRRAPEGPAANVTRLYALCRDRRAGTPAPRADFAHALRAHHTLDFITSGGERHRATSCDGDTE